MVDQLLFFGNIPKQKLDSKITICFRVPNPNAPRSSKVKGCQKVVDFYPFAIQQFPHLMSSKIQILNVFIIDWRGSFSRKEELCS